MFFMDIFVYKIIDSNQWKLLVFIFLYEQIDAIRISVNVFYNLEYSIAV